MTPFGFVIHPLSPRDAARKYPVARYLPEAAIEAFLARKKPMVVSHITGVRSVTGAETHGWFVGCPLTPRQMVGKLPLELVYDRIGEAVELARREGAQVVGLGAFTSVVGDGGVTIAERSKVAVTTGNSYTVATAIEGTLVACGMVGIVPETSALAVVGATGSIGRTCAQILSERFQRLVLVGRDQARTEAVAEALGRGEPTTDVAALRECDAVVTVTSSDAAVLLPQHLKPGAVVCDVARPRDVSVRVARERPDVLVIEGGVVEVPGEVDFGFDFGFPPRTAYACMSETMILALENRPESYTVGKDVTVRQVREMLELAAKHGFRLAGFRSFERAVDEQAIERVRRARLRV
ncbi:MAG: hypothetical protein N2109_06030 [Fimbriimonadales bacterium]|nr:hypothetical protein [Fimbriimonadales bacterium]